MLNKINTLIITAAVVRRQYMFNLSIELNGPPSQTVLQKISHSHEKKYSDMSFENNQASTNDNSELARQIHDNLNIDLI